MEEQQFPGRPNEVDDKFSSDPGTAPGQAAAEAAATYPAMSQNPLLVSHPRAGMHPMHALPRLSAAPCTIYEKIGCPERFRPRQFPPPGTIGQELAALRKLLLENRIQLLVSSPNISDQELFRFMTGEFMDIRITDDGSPLFHCFLYDDYHPDPFFDNEQTALNRCIRFLLDKNLHCNAGIFMGKIDLNQYEQLSTRDALALIQSFKEQYDEIVTLELNPGKTTIRDQVCEVSGSHATGFIRKNKCLLRTGRWDVRFALTDNGEWKIAAIRIEDVEL